MARSPPASLDMRHAIAEAAHSVALVVLPPFDARELLILLGVLRGVPDLADLKHALDLFERAPEHLIFVPSPRRGVVSDGRDADEQHGGAELNRGIGESTTA